MNPEDGMAASTAALIRALMHAAGPPAVGVSLTAAQAVDFVAGRLSPSEALLVVERAATSHEDRMLLLTVHQSIENMRSRPIRDLAAVAQSQELEAEVARLWRHAIGPGLASDRIAHRLAGQFASYLASLLSRQNVWSAATALRTSEVLQVEDDEGGGVSVVGLRPTSAGLMVEITARKPIDVWLMVEIDGVLLPLRRLDLVGARSEVLLPPAWTESLALLARAGRLSVRACPVPPNDLIVVLHPEPGQVGTTRALPVLRDEVDANGTLILALSVDLEPTGAGRRAYLEFPTGGGHWQVLEAFTSADLAKPVLDVTLPRGAWPEQRPALMRLRLESMSGHHDPLR
jgi:hypothetical protein